jgi:sugar phosphate isomerase/epimerase
MKLDHCHLAYCTNIHPAESWEETQTVLATHLLAVRDRLRESGHLGPDAPFAIGLRLSARAARELLAGDHLSRFRDWLAATGTYVFTINGFPYGDFHGTRVKERVFLPDWTAPERLAYTRDLFRILTAIAPPGAGASVSTLPGSLKAFQADESAIRRQLIELAGFLDDLAESSGHDCHLGLEPEPLGHFENSAETLGFFERLHADSRSPDVIRRRIGVNYDTCHFALQYEAAGAALDRLLGAGIRLSKIHLSSAPAFDPRDPAALAAIRAFEEPTYFHQTLVRHPGGTLTRYPDLPEFLASSDRAAPELAAESEARVHFHIPLDTEPAPPLRSTRGHVTELLEWWRGHPESCSHFEIETYTWAVLPAALQRPVADQIAAEFRWALARFRADPGGTQAPTAAATDSHFQ